MVCDRGKQHSDCVLGEMMRPRIKAFVRMVAETLPIYEPIYEFGSLRVDNQDELANLRPIFPGKEYVGCDMRAGRGVDRVLNLHSIDLPDETAGTVLCLDTMEHVEYPHLALEEMYRILKPGGICVISSVMHFKIHSYPDDYWRFTPSGFTSLLKPFDNSWVGWKGVERFPHTVVGIGLKGPIDLEAFLQRWEERCEAC